MNGRKAKRIRRGVYGDQSLRNRRRYVGITREGEKGKAVQILNDPNGLRAAYKRAKRQA